MTDEYQPHPDGYTPDRWCAVCDADLTNDRPVIEIDIEPVARARGTGEFSIGSEMIPWPRESMVIWLCGDCAAEHGVIDIYRKVSNEEAFRGGGQ